jgi:hypothetical protein
MSTQKIVESSSALFFLTSGMNIAGLIGGGVLLGTDAFGGRDTLLLANAPILLGVGATFATLALPVVLRRSLLRRSPRWLADVSAGIEAACRSLLKPSWRLLGAVGYLGFDVAVLGVLFAACGHPIPIDVLVLGYIIGYLANSLPVPGGFGVFGGRAGRDVGRLRRARDRRGGGCCRLSRDRVLDSEPRRASRLRASPPPRVASKRTLGDG